MSSGSPVRPPPIESGPSSPELQRGNRVWWFRCGEWVEAVVRGWQGPGVSVSEYAGRFSAAQHVHTVPRHYLKMQQPDDCGAMVPPTGAQGVAYWLQKDVRVFANCWGAGKAVPRPRVLWEPEGV
jgi:hypothetical protein